MKTVLDAVIEFKGECDAAIDSNVAYSSDSWDWLAGLHHSLTDIVFVCTTDEFNALVDELASNFGKCDISYQKHCSNEVIRLEGDEMKTVTHEGKVIQIGATYEFTDSDKGQHWELGVLNDYANDKGVGAGFQSKTGSKFEWFKHIRLQQAPVGTITEAPVELVDGECYQFDHIDAIWEKPVKGFYKKESASFFMLGDCVNTKFCTNIKPLTVEK